MTVKAGSHRKDYERIMKGLRLERGGGQRISLSCACFLIAQPFLNISRHIIHQIEAENHSHPMMSVMS